MNLNKDKRADPKPRTDFKNVEKKIPHFSDYEDAVIRPRVNRVEDLNRLADEIKSSPTAIVNFLVDVGLEILERGKDGMKKELENKLKKLLKWGNKMTVLDLKKILESFSDDFKVVIINEEYSKFVEVCKVTLFTDDYDGFTNDGLDISKIIILDEDF